MKKSDISVKKSNVCEQCGHKLNLYDKVVNYFNTKYNIIPMCSSCMGNLKREKKIERERVNKIERERIKKIERERELEMINANFSRKILKKMVEVDTHMRGYGITRDYGLLNTKIENGICEIHVKINFTNSTYDNRNTYDNKMESKRFYFTNWLGIFIKKIRHLNYICEYNEIFIQFYGNSFNKYGNIASTDMYAWIKINTSELAKINFDVLFRLYGEYKITNLFEYEIGSFPNKLD